jgi:hypothetical protein
MACSGAASCRTLFDVQRNGDAGPPDAVGSTKRYSLTEPNRPFCDTLAIKSSTLERKSLRVADVFAL